MSFVTLPLFKTFVAPCMAAEVGSLFGVTYGMLVGVTAVDRMLQRRGFIRWYQIDDQWYIEGDARICVPGLSFGGLVGCIGGAELGHTMGAAVDNHLFR